jgi:hypothetical protein
MFLPDTDDAGQLEALYIRHFDSMTRVATVRFHIPKEAAADMAHDILMASIHQSPRIKNAPRWFRGAIAYASRRYHSTRARG